MAGIELAEVQHRLERAVALLQPAQILLLVRMAEAMSVRIDSRIAADSDIATKNFSLALSNYLLLHHANHEERLNKKAFEYAFKYACLADGRRVSLNTDSIRFAEDIRVDGVNFSLKTQADKNIKPGSIYIQKLMEARWIRECITSNDFARGVQERVARHLAHYERILVLRAFEVSTTCVRYELTEIPRDLLLRICLLQAHNFSERNKYGSSGAEVRDEKGVAFRILLDGSVEKVRIFNLRADRCRLHGEWLIPRPDAGSSDDTDD